MYTGSFYLHYIVLCSVRCVISIHIFMVKLFYKNTSQLSETYSRMTSESVLHIFYVNLV